MRIWSLHPKYLDAKGLVALWRETLLAKNVLEDKTKGYKNHPQLNRFKASEYPVNAINQYLIAVYKEAERRGYKFDSSKIDWTLTAKKILVTKGQMEYELRHLLTKLLHRDKLKYEKLKSTKNIENHPLFEITEGDIEKWEVITEPQKNTFRLQNIGE